jgi:hypothetical protein
MRPFVTSSVLAAALWTGVTAALPVTAFAQTTASVAPTLIPVSGQLLTAGGQPRTGNVLLVISLYEDEGDMAPRWIEHQAVTLDADGRYSVNFGSTRVEGLPTDLFTGADPTRWIGVAVENEAEQPRVTLVSVPYAAKAASADTLAGRAATDFVLTSNLENNVRAVLQEDGLAAAASVDGGLNHVQKGNGAGGTIDSSLFETAGGRFGIGTTAPGSRLHVVDTDESEFRLQIAGGPLAVMRATSWGGANFGSFSAHPVSFYTSSQERMRINAAGNVGIGTAVPFSRLHIFDTNQESEFRLEVKDGAMAVVRGVRGAADIGSFTNHPLRIFTNSTEAMRVAANGNVGIGTQNPTAKLQVDGDVIVNGNIGAKYQDVAEWVDSVEPLDAGSVVVVDVTATNRVTAATRAYDGRVAGAVSAQPGIVLGEAGPGKVLVAQSGRVKVKADARNGAIRPGDLLVTSPIKGHVMRSRPVKMGDQLVHRPGTIVGKALEGLAKGRGEILVLLTLQ